jgi:hypothetical protein
MTVRNLTDQRAHLDVAGSPVPDHRARHHQDEEEGDHAGDHRGPPTGTATRLLRRGPAGVEVLHGGGAGGVDEGQVI